MTHCWIRRGLRLILTAIVSCSAPIGLAAIPLTPENAGRIGQKVWQNECAGTITGLVSWNSGENFPSLGIGHFIWYPKGNRGPFEESFPKLVALMKQRGVKTPPWLSGPAPWANRAEMLRDPQRVGQLRQLLAQTIAIQTELLIQRLDAALPRILETVPVSRRPLIRSRFEQLITTPAGLFALVDYVNFKGEGILETERYRGEGWGLLQVLDGMRGQGDPLNDFSSAAVQVLARRVKNAPPERHEERWLPGWSNRVKKYVQR